MEQYDNGASSKRRLQKKSKAIIVFPILLMIIAIFAILYLVFPEPIKQLRATFLKPAIEEQTIGLQVAGPEIDADQQKNNLVEPPRGNDLDPAEQQLAMGALPPPSTTPDQDKELSETTSAVVCEGRADTIEQFFNTLDSRPYIERFKIGEKSSSYFPQLIQKLVDNPPVVTGEMNDIFTILQNTAHFFRIIGKKNIVILKGILDQEKATFEATLADFYQLTNNPECMQEQFDLKISDDSLYSYAGFFLNTMGGRLYLFRRDSMSRMIVNYYAILTVDLANREGRNKYGVEIDTAIDRLIGDIESSSIDLKMRETYLDTLYNLKVKYQ